MGKQSTDHAQNGGASGTGKARVVPQSPRVGFPPSYGPSGAGKSGVDRENRNKRS